MILASFCQIACEVDGDFVVTEVMGPDRLSPTRQRATFIAVDPKQLLHYSIDIGDLAAAVWPLALAQPFDTHYHPNSK
jgi:hypothetical protein